MRGIVIIEAIRYAEPGTERSGKKPGPRCGSYKRERPQAKLDRLRPRSAVDHNVHSKILHRRIQILFDLCGQTLDLIYKEDFERLEGGQYAGKVARLFPPPTPGYLSF